MHELGEALELFEVIKKEAKKNGLKKVSRITIRIGEASGIKIDFLRHSFLDHILPKNSIVKEAKVEIIPETIKLKCKDCKREVVEDSINPLCPSCGSSNLEIIAGKDTYIESIEGE